MAESRRIYLIDKESRQKRCAKIVIQTERFCNMVFTSLVTTVIRVVIVVLVVDVVVVVVATRQSKAASISQLN